jgi:hypothetical protein
MVVSNASALWSARACSQSSRILSSSRLVGILAPRAILSTDRRYVRYRTYCIFEGKLDLAERWVIFESRSRRGFLT